MIFFFLCLVVCNEDTRCRTFDYDSQLLICRLFEGAIQTGTVVSTGSSNSAVGSVRFLPNFFAAYGLPCSACTQNRYLICSSMNGSNICQCPTGTFWNGNECKNRLYEDQTCSTNSQCRTDAGFNCTKAHFCSSKMVD